MSFNSSLFVMDFQQHTSRLSRPQGGAIARTHEAHFFAYLKPAEVNIAVKTGKREGAGAASIFKAQLGEWLGKGLQLLSLKDRVGIPLYPCFIGSIQYLKSPPNICRMKSRNLETFFPQFPHPGLLSVSLWIHNTNEQKTKIICSILKGRISTQRDG